MSAAGMNHPLMPARNSADLPAGVIQAPIAFSGRFVCTTVGLLALAIASGLYRYDTLAYFRIMTAWMLIPFVHPFIDWEWIPSAVGCWAKGVNVYVDNTCYAPFIHGRHGYSPLWLRATFLATGEAWVIPMGLALGALFLLSLTLLPLPKYRSGLAVMLLATLSSMTAFAVERGNVDLLIFLLVMIGVCLWAGRLPVRLLA